ncbi:MAG: hypothetical protein ACYCOU_18935 [Sulfobacillus sp.]
MAGTFAEVMGSNTSWLYAENNRLIGEAITTDIEGDQRRLESRVRHFNLDMKVKYEATLDTFRNYDFYGAFDLWVPFFGARLAFYFNQILPDSITGHTQLLERADSHGEVCECDRLLTEGANVTFRKALAKRTLEFLEFLDDAGKYYEGNRGKFSAAETSTLRPSLWDKMYLPRDSLVEEREDMRSFEEASLFFVRRMAELKGLSFSSEAFRRAFVKQWTTEQTLSELAIKSQILD